MFSSFNIKRLFAITFIIPFVTYSLQFISFLSRENVIVQSFIICCRFPYLIFLNNLFFFIRKHYCGYAQMEKEVEFLNYKKNKRENHNFNSDITFRQVAAVTSSVLKKICLGIELR